MDSLHLSLLLYYVFIFGWIFVTYKSGTWKKWRIYYPTILFFCVGSLIGFAVFHHHLLWEFKSKVFSHIEIDLIQIIFIFSCTTILFLHYYPRRIMGQVFYILLWVAIYSTVEGLFHLLGGIEYNRGWGINWSIAHNIYQFILLRIHHKNPILAWILSFIMIKVVMCIFAVQL